MCAHAYVVVLGRLNPFVVVGRTPAAIEPACPALRLPAAAWNRERTRARAHPR